jgi:hypothetical protein
MTRTLSVTPALDALVQGCVFEESFTTGPNRRTVQYRAFGLYWNDRLTPLRHSSATTLESRTMSSKRASPLDSSICAALRTGMTATSSVSLAPRRLSPGLCLRREPHDPFFGKSASGNRHKLHTDGARHLDALAVGGELSSRLIDGKDMKRARALIGCDQVFS